MKRILVIVFVIALLFALKARSAEYGNRYVAMMYDTEKHVIFPVAAGQLVTNGPAFRELSGNVESNSAYAHDLETRVFSVITLQSEVISDALAASTSNSAAISSVEGEVVRIAGLQLTNSMLSAQAMAMVYDFSGRVQGNTDSISANAAGIESNSASILGLEAALEELSGKIGSSQPAIETPDGKKWKAVGVYTESGKPTFAWSRCEEGNYGTIVLDMPDDRHYKMTGMYTEQGKVTHTWEEITHE